ncbi:UNVERIFIED_CONTAM: hypothetical protein Sindi_2899000 [Sesamum indicum]
MAIPRTTDYTPIWEPGMAMRKLQHTQVPIWIKLRHLPMEYWTSEGLSTVASGVGKPLYPDAITRACTRLDFARVCVIIDINQKLTKHIVVMTPDEDGGETPCKVDVDYEWLPPKCATCMKVGHTTKECAINKLEKPTKPPVKVYVPKVNAPPPPPPEKKRTPTVVTQNTDIGDVHVERKVSNHDDRVRQLLYTTPLTLYMNLTMQTRFRGVLTHAPLSEVIHVELCRVECPWVEQTGPPARIKRPGLRIQVTSPRHS